MDQPNRTCGVSAGAVTALLLLTIVVRGGLLWLRADSLGRDPDGYRRLAENLVANGVYGDGQTPTAYRPPLYPLVLAALARTVGLSAASIGGLHLVLGVATVWLVLRLGIAWGLDRYALLGAALVACDPILLHQSTLVMTETLSAFLAALALATLTAVARRPSLIGACGAGLAIALAVLCRSTFAVMLVLAPAAILWLARIYKPDAQARNATDGGTTPSLALRASVLRASSVRVAAVIFLSAISGLAPWAIRNGLVFGRPIFTTTHGGYTLLLGNNPAFYEHLRTAPRGSVWSAENLALPTGAQKDRDELRDDRILYDEALRNIRTQPAMFLRACLRRVVRLWGVLPYQVDRHEGVAGRWLRYAAAVWYALELALAAAGAWSLRSKLVQTPWLFGIVLAIGFTAVHGLYWTDLRMRAPLMPVTALLAAAPWAWIAFKWRGATA